MVNSPRPSDNHGRDTQGYEPRPRWVTVLVVVAAAAALIVVVMLVSGGEHGPGRHMGDPLNFVPARVGGVLAGGAPGGTS